jgi:hypothetical protein
LTFPSVIPSGEAASPASLQQATPQTQQTPSAKANTKGQLDAAEAHALMQWLDDSQSQMTYLGLVQCTGALRDGEVAVLYRNLHFSTVVLHGGIMHSLVTDLGYAGTAVAFERLDEVNNNTELVDQRFQLIRPGQDGQAGPTQGQAQASPLREPATGHMQAPAAATGAAPAANDTDPLCRCISGLVPISALADNPRYAAAIRRLGISPASSSAAAIGAAVGAGDQQHDADFLLAMQLQRQEEQEEEAARWAEEQEQMQGQMQRQRQSPRDMHWSDVGNAARPSSAAAPYSTMQAGPTYAVRTPQAQAQSAGSAPGARPGAAVQTHSAAAGASVGNAATAPVSPGGSSGVVPGRNDRYLQQANTLKALAEERERRRLQQQQQTVDDARAARALQELEYEGVESVRLQERQRQQRGQNTDKGCIIS